MKKIPLISLITILLTLTFISGNITHAKKYFSGTRVAYISLPDEYHPDYAPVASMDKSGQKTSAPEDKLKSAADYGNYFLQLIAGGLLYLAGPAAILVIAIAGLRYTASHGEQNEMDGAKKTLTYAVVGLIIIILSYAIVKAIITAALKIG